MAKTRTDSAVGQIRTLFTLGRVGDRADGEILESFKAHHVEAEAAFKELVARHGAMVLQVCRRVLRDPHDVEDAFQATFLILVRRAGSIRNCDALGGWLHRVALRVALRARTEAASRREAEQKAAPESSKPDLDDVERAEIRTALDEELDRIPGPYRAAIIACYLEGLTHEEAANRLRLPVGTVRSRLSRGRDRLRERLVRRGLAPGVALPALGRAPAVVPAALYEAAARSLVSHLAVRSGAGAVPSAVTALAERVIRAMKLKLLGLCAAVALAVGAVVGMLPLLSMEGPGQGKATAAQAERPDPATSLAGIVRDSDGRPVAGATVVASALSPRRNRQITISGQDGRYAFQGKEGAEKLVYVLAYKAGLAPASKLRPGFLEGTPAGEVELVLLRAEPFVGIVQGRDGRPIAGATVRVLYMRGRKEKNEYSTILRNVLEETPLASLVATVTDKQGGFRFPAVPSPQGVVLDLSAEGLGDLSTEVPGDREAGYISGSAAMPARLTMDREARVLGKLVTRLPGVSVAGLKVALQNTNDSTRFWRDALTNADGRFEMRGLPEGGGNLFPYDHPTDGPWTYRAIDNLALHPGKTNEVTIELIEGVLVEGRIAEAGTGKPIAGVFVGMYGPARPRSGAAILSATTDAMGRYRFRLPPGVTYLYTAGGRPARSGSQSVVIPADVKTFTAPTIEVNQAAAPPPAAPRAATPARSKEDGTLAVAGLVCDVSDQPVGGALVVGARMQRDVAFDRRIVRADSRGRFSFSLPAAKRAGGIAYVCAFKEGLAPAAIRVRPFDAPLDGAVKLVLARTRPFVGVVVDHQRQPIAGAKVQVQSLKVPVLEGAGTMVMELPWPIIESTPLDGEFRTTTDAQGMFRFPSVPARSQLNLVVTAKGMAVHRTSDFNRPNMTGIRPNSFDAGFLRGTIDSPGRIYLAPEKRALAGMMNWSCKRKTDGTRPRAAGLTELNGAKDGHLWNTGFFEMVEFLVKPGDRRVEALGERSSGGFGCPEYQP